MKSNIVRIAPFVCILLFLFLSYPGFAVAVQSVFDARVMQIKDGDTIVVAPLDGGAFTTCRLYGIDTPETAKKGKPGQPFGEEAAQELKRLLLGQMVTVTTTGARTYRREVCLIRKNGDDVNLAMVRAGYAWAYRQYLKRPYASEYLEAEREAREKQLGLWSEANPNPPWEFRKSLRHH